MDTREILLSPIQIGARTCANRFFSQPMECTDADAEGNPSDLTYERYENLFKIFVSAEITKREVL